MKRVFANLIAGMITAFVMMSFAVSYGALVFGHPLLKAHVGLGIHAALVATIVLLIVNAIFSSFSFSLAGPDSNSTVLLAGLAGSIASILTAQGKPIGTILPTVFVGFAMAGLCVGTIAFLLGAFRQGRKAAYIPFPVTAGFLAGTGLLVVQGGIRLLQTSESTAGGSDRLEPYLLAFLITGGIIVLPRLWKHYLAMPLVVTVGLVACRLILPPTEIPSNWQGFSDPFIRLFTTDLPHIDRVVLCQHVFYLLPFLVVVILTSLLNSAGLDLESPEEGEFDRELRSIGIALMFSGAVGGLLGHVSASRSFLHRQAGADSRWAGVAAALFCIVFIWLAPQTVISFPRPVMAALLLSTGLIMLKKWVWDSLRKQAIHDTLLIMVILLLVTFHGPVAGVIFGTMITALFFVYRYSRIPCVKNRFSCGEFLSNRDRPVQHINCLMQTGRRGKALLLQGYVFFGTATTLYDEVRDMTRDWGVSHLLLDFTSVQGIDTSAALGFCKLESYCATHHLTLIMSGIQTGARQALEQAGFRVGSHIHYADDLDRGLELMENQILTLESEILPEAAQVADAETDFRKILAPFDVSPETFDLLRTNCETVVIPAQSFLMKRDDTGMAIYFVEKGSLTVGWHLDNGHFKRIRTLGPGSVVGEMRFFTGQSRSADVITTSECRVLKLTRERFDALVKQAPQATAEFQVFIIKLLAFRLSNANSHQVIAR